MEARLIILKKKQYAGRGSGASREQAAGYTTEIEETENGRGKGPTSAWHSGPPLAEHTR